MTKRERAIVMAYTGTVMLAGDDLGEFYSYIAELIGRPVWTHELADPDMVEKIKQLASPAFIDLCRDQTQGEDLVAVVRCKDCENGHRDGHGFCECFYNVFEDRLYLEYFFCGHGKRREAKT